MENNQQSTKFCKKCGEAIPVNSKKCPKCGAYQTLPILVIVLVAIIVVLVISLLVANNGKEDNSLNNNENNNTTNSNQGSDNHTQTPSFEVPSENETSTNNTYGFDETFVFDQLEITIGSTYSFDTVNNRYSDYNNQTVVRLPITIKNIANETHGLNMFSYNVYGSKGTEVATLNSYFDDDIDYAGDLRSGASYTKYMYFLYDGNGTYAIEFDDWYNTITVEFDITN